MDRTKFAFDKTNFILLGIGMIVIIHIQYTPYKSGTFCMLCRLYLHDIRHTAQT